MPTSHTKRSVPWMAIVIGVLLLACYVGAYSLLAEPVRSKVFIEPAAAYTFKSPSVARAFIPMAWIESKAKRGAVVLFAESKTADATHVVVYGSYP